MGGAAGGAGTDDSGTLPPGVNVGPVDLFSEPGLHQVAGTTLLVGRDPEGLFARSSLCTHAGCNLNEDGASQPSGGIRCGCHGSQFDATGSVLAGPANRPLPALSIELGDDGNLYVDSNTLVDSSARLVP
jgi:Rieske Fe-S protein